MKNGKTTAGRTRWRCKHCGSSATQTRTDISRKAEFTAFHDWLTGTTGRRAQSMPIRTFSRRTAWCWNVAPSISPTGQIHDQIMLDGTYFNGWCVLIAHTGHHVLAWQWADQEKNASWTALLERLPPPAYAIIDGNKPLTHVIRRLWPGTGIQRCLFHIRQAGHKHLTRRPVLPANKELLALYRTLSKVTTLDEAAAWTASFATWEARWNTFLKHRTYPTRTTPRPVHVRPQQKSWWTHLRTRRAWLLLKNLLRHDELFTWLSAAEQGITIARATSALEGGPNKSVKDFLRHHRGLHEAHARRGIDWLLYRLTEHPKDPWTFVGPQHWAPQKRVPRRSTNEQIGPAVYDTAFSAEDGNGIQRGWGGRNR